MESLEFLNFCKRYKDLEIKKGDLVKFKNLEELEVDAKNSSSTQVKTRIEFLEKRFYCCNMLYNKTMISTLGDTYAAVEAINGDRIILKNFSVLEINPHVDIRWTYTKAMVYPVISNENNLKKGWENIFYGT